MAKGESRPNGLGLTSEQDAGLFLISGRRAGDRVLLDVVIKATLLLSVVG